MPINERGFACIALDSPKCRENIGGVLRAANCYRVAQVSISQSRAKVLSQRTNTMKAHRHMPTYLVDDPLAVVPYDTQIVAVDLVEGAEPLTTFQHPNRAMYIFGAEDATLGERVLSRAQHRVYIPTRQCMNLAATVNVLLYDRMVKGGAYDAAYEAPKDHSYNRTAP